MAQIVGERVNKGDAIVDYEDKVFEDIQAEPGEKAYILMHTVPFEGSVGLVNMLTATRINRKGFDTHLVLYGPGSLMASATRGYPKVGDEAFPGAPATTSSCRPSWTRAARSTRAGSPPRRSTACGRST